MTTPGERAAADVAIAQWMKDIGPEGKHAGHEWKEVPPCVYCVTCNERLYEGSIPEWKDPALAAAKAACEHLEHLMDDDGGEHGQGFYWVCADCGYQGWYD